MNAALSSEMAVALRESVGTRRALLPLNRLATPDAVRRFALGVGDDNPHWWRDDANQGVLPSFLYSGANFGSWPDSGMPRIASGQPTTTLWMGDRWIWHRPIGIGEGFEATSEIAEADDWMRGNMLCGIVLRERVLFTSDNGLPLAELLRSTITVPRRRAAPPVAAVPDKFDAAEIARIEDCYDAEIGRRQGARPRIWDNVFAGDLVGPIVKGPLTVTNLVGFAMGWGAPLCPTNRILHRWTRENAALTVYNARTGMAESSEGIHWDPDVSSALGFDRGFDFGPQRISWAIHLCTDWMGDTGELIKIDARLLKPNFLGDVTWIDGTVTRRWIDDAGRALVEIMIDGHNQNGLRTTTARAVIVLPRA